MGTTNPHYGIQQLDRLVEHVANGSTFDEALVAVFDGEFDIEQLGLTLEAAVESLVRP